MSARQFSSVASASISCGTGGTDFLVGDAHFGPVQPTADGRLFLFTALDSGSPPAVGGNDTLIGGTGGTNFLVGDAHFGPVQPTADGRLFLFTHTPAPAVQYFFSHSSWLNVLGTST